MAYLSIKLDHVAWLREHRKAKFPAPSHAAVLAELAGADGITVHLRRDKRHVAERDLYVLKEVCKSRLTIELQPGEANLDIVRKLKPYQVTFVNESDSETISQEGYSLDEDFEFLEEPCHQLQELGIKVGVSIDPAPDYAKKAAKIGADAVKIQTGMYINARDEKEGIGELEKIESTGKAAGKNELIVMAGQGLDYHNILPLIKLNAIDEYVVGHAVIAKAVLIGMERAVRDLLDIVRFERAV